MPTRAMRAMSTRWASSCPLTLDSASRRALGSVVSASVAPASAASVTTMSARGVRMTRSGAMIKWGTPVAAWSDSAVVNSRRMTYSAAPMSGTTVRLMPRADRFGETDAGNPLGHEHEARPALLIVVLEPQRPRDARVIRRRQAREPVGNRLFDRGELANEPEQLDRRAVGVDPDLALAKAVAESRPAVGVELDLLLLDRVRRGLDRTLRFFRRLALHAFIKGDVRTVAPAEA